MDLLLLLVLDAARKMSIVYPTSSGFAKVFSYHLITEKPNSKKILTENSKWYSSRILPDQNVLSFNISNQTLTKQSLNPTFGRI